MKNVRTIFLFPIISAVMIWGCRQEKSVSSPPLRLPVAEVIAGDVPVTMSFVGQTYGRNDITIQARVSGFLRSIRKGELLYVIEPQPYEAQTARSTAAVRQAEAEMIAARQNYDRVKPLAETSAASKSDLDQAVARLSAARASLNAAQASLDYTRIEQGYTRISSPLNGIIGRTLARVGDYVGEGSQYTVLNTVSFTYRNRPITTCSAGTEPGCTILRYVSQAMSSIRRKAVSTSSAGPSNNKPDRWMRRSRFPIPTRCSGRDSSPGSRSWPTRFTERS